MERSASAKGSNDNQKAAETGVDSVYYQHAGTIAGARNISASARIAMFELFLQQLMPTKSSRILDIGVSDEEGPETNMLEQRYPWQENLVCAGLGNGERLREFYPKISYVRIGAGLTLPFRDKAFDIVYSNAVLEHVGGKEQRADFLREVVRVGRSAFITLPNKWFPLEHHTGMPILHWSPRLFRLLVKWTPLRYWSDSKNVDFISKSSLQSEWPSPVLPKIVYCGVKLGPFSSNLAVVAPDL